MTAQQNVSIGVHLQQVPIHCVKHQATRKEGGVIGMNKVMQREEWIGEGNIIYFRCVVVVDIISRLLFISPLF